MPADAVTAKMPITSSVDGMPVGFTVAVAGLVMEPTEVTVIVDLTTVVVADCAKLVKAALASVAWLACPRKVTSVLVALMPTVNCALDAPPEAQVLVSALTVSLKVPLAGIT